MIPDPSHIVKSDCVAQQAREGDIWHCMVCEGRRGYCIGWRYGNNHYSDTCTVMGHGDDMVMS